MSNRVYKNDTLEPITNYAVARALGWKKLRSRPYGKSMEIWEVPKSDRQFKHELASKGSSTVAFHRGTFPDWIGSLDEMFSEMAWHGLKPGGIHEDGWHVNTGYNRKLGGSGYRSFLASGAFTAWSIHHPAEALAKAFILFLKDRK